jgi:hypothetical protein
VVFTGYPCSDVAGCALSIVLRAFVRGPCPGPVDGSLENRRLALRYDRFGFIVQSLLQAASPANFENSH